MPGEPISLSGSLKSAQRCDRERSSWAYARVSGFPSTSAIRPLFHKGLAPNLRLVAPCEELRPGRLDALWVTTGGSHMRRAIFAISSSARAGAPP